MALPRIDKPLFKMMMPSKQKEVTSRPFLVKEEKILLMAQMSGTEKDIILAIKQILQNCIQDEWFDADDLTTFDLEYMFLKLRARSVNNIVKLSYEDLEDGKRYDFDVDLDKIELTYNEKHSNKIAITDDIGIIMRYPTVDDVQTVSPELNYIEMLEELVYKCVDKIYDNENVYPASQELPEELRAFLEGLDVNTYQKIREFFETLPKLTHRITYTNSLNNERFVELRNLKDFFTWG